MQDETPAFHVMGTRVHALCESEALARVVQWAQGRESRYVCACNVHMVVTASRTPALASAVNGADLVIPDGAPIAWALRRMGVAGQQRIAGPDFMLSVCSEAARNQLSVFLLGGTIDTLNRLIVRLGSDFPDLKVAGIHAPPFRALTPAEDAAIVDEINSSAAELVFVGLGCPKQELWMGSHRAEVRSVMLGVGAAFDFAAGSLPRAPMLMRRAGLEWLHRLICEPRRLWKRYFVTNTLFFLGIARQLVGRRRAGKGHQKGHQQSGVEEDPVPGDRCTASKPMGGP